MNGSVPKLMALQRRFEPAPHWYAVVEIGPWEMTIHLRPDFSGAVAARGCALALARSIVATFPAERLESEAGAPGSVLARLLPEGFAVDLRRRPFNLGRPAPLPRDSQ